ncbi:MAG: DinB family protein [Flavobacteriales bacterium]|nr:DinB family protein [Flavobacteriales bacterium]
MQKQLEILTTTRTNVLKAIEGLTLEELNTIPTRFKNNIIWNVAHLVVTQQLLCYKLSGLDMYLQNEFVDKYKKGSEVDFEVTQEEVDDIKKQLSELPKQLVDDYNNSIFKSFAEYPTSYNFTLNSIEDAIQFNNVHEGLHFGYMMAMKKVIHN